MTLFGSKATGKVAMLDLTPPTDAGGIEAFRTTCATMAADPESYFAETQFNADLNYLEVAAEDSVIHTQLAAPAASLSTPTGGSGGDSGGVVNAAYGYGVSREDFLVCTHNLGYEPYAAVVVGGKVLHPGMPVQVGTAGAVRYATAYSTTTEIRVETWCSVGADALPSADITYSAIAFRAPRAKSGNILLGRESGGPIQMGLNKFSADRKLLQVVDGGSPFAFIAGRAIDADNGAGRYADGDGGVTDTVPDTTKMAIVSVLITADSDPNVVTPTHFGDPLTYGGTFASPPTFQVQVPDDPPGGDSGLSYDAATGVMKITYQGRNTLTNAGKLIGLLDEETLSHTVSFPNIATNANWVWGYRTRSLSVSPPFEYYYDRWGKAWMAAPPVEWSSVTNLVAVPAGADLAVGLARLQRTTAPDDWIGGDPIEALPKQAVWIPFVGSFNATMEAAYGMIRMISVYIEDGYLKLWQKQSVGAQPGGYETFDLSFTSGGYPRSIQIQHYGDAAAGLPVKMVWDTNTSKYTGGGPTTLPPLPTLHKWDGSSPPVPPAAPAFASEYTLDLKVSVGRKS